MNFEKPDLNLPNKSEIKEKDKAEELPGDESSGFVEDSDEKSSTNERSTENETHKREFGEQELLSFEDTKKRIEEEYDCTWGEYAEKEEKETFDSYMNNLGLKEENLIGKKVVDIGAGDRFFASYCLKNGITEDVYSIEPKIFESNIADQKLREAAWGEEVEKKLGEKTVVAVNEELPFKDESVDLVVSNYALPGRAGELHDDTYRDSIEKSFNEIIRVLKPEGEARLGVVSEEIDDFFVEWKKAFFEKLSTLNNRSDLYVALEKTANENDLEYRIVIKKIGETKESVIDFYKGKIETIKDAEGHGVDEYIKKLCVSLMVNEVFPVASCEGHTETSSYGAPWVEIASPGEPKNRFKREDEVFEGVAEKYEMKLEEVKRMYNLDAYWEALSECEKNGETDEYIRWREKNSELKSRISNLLDEFYEDRKVSDDIKIRVKENEEGDFRIYSGKNDYNIIENDLEDDQKEELEERMKKYRAEMNAFADFLEKKFLEK